VTEEFRVGDTRHIFGDGSKIKKKLGFEAKTPFKKGLEKLIEWSEKQQAVDKFEEAEKERLRYMGG
jgi:dTDP-L-rhamnose 4-epimerase